jgi:hypothetical protein
MKIGFYGHSNCAYRSSDSFIDIIANHFGAEIVNTGVKQGSEERILYELKKTKQLDLAVIFHSIPSSIFLPNCNRDLVLRDMSDIRMQYLLFEQEKDITVDHEDYNQTLKKQFYDIETFKNVLEVHKNYFYNPDVLLNRYYGALIQIDKYLIDKQIPTIHVLEKTLPRWLSLQSGIVDFNIMKLTKQHRLLPDKRFVSNCITIEGNLKVADNLKLLMNQILQVTGCGSLHSQPPVL